MIFCFYGSKIAFLSIGDKTIWLEQSRDSSTKARNTACFYLWDLSKQGCSDVGDRDPLSWSMLQCWRVTASQGLPQLLRAASTQITLGPGHLSCNKWDLGMQVRLWCWGPGPSGDTQFYTAELSGLFRLFQACTPLSSFVPRWIPGQGHLASQIWYNVVEDLPPGRGGCFSSQGLIELNQNFERSLVLPWIYFF